MPNFNLSFWISCVRPAPAGRVAMSILPREFHGNEPLQRIPGLAVVLSGQLDNPESNSGHHRP
jgi:hypothetical protein